MFTSAAQIHSLLATSWLSLTSAAILLAGHVVPSFELALAFGWVAAVRIQLTKYAPGE